MLRNFGGAFLTFVAAPLHDGPETHVTKNMAHDNKCHDGRWYLT